MNDFDEFLNDDTAADTEIDSAEDLPADSLANDFDDLEALLSESVKTRDENLAMREKKKALSRGQLPSSERKSIEQLVASWETKKEWTPAAAVQMFSAQLCSNCGTTHHHFLGTYQRQANKNNRKISRWIKSDDIANRGLPSEAKCEDSTAPICCDCSNAFEDA